MELGRKLLKKSPTQYDSDSARTDTATCCALSSRRHRQTLTIMIIPWASNAASSQTGCTRCSIRHNASRLVPRSTKAMRPMLRASFARTAALRVRARREAGVMQGGCTPGRFPPRHTPKAVTVA
jgi:hypothetical protein